MSDYIASKGFHWHDVGHAATSRLKGVSLGSTGCAPIMSGMDFVSDALFDGRRPHMLTVIDLHTRECLGIGVGQNLKAADVAEELDRVVFLRVNP